MIGSHAWLWYALLSAWGQWLGVALIVVGSTLVAVMGIKE